MPFGILPVAALLCASFLVSPQSTLPTYKVPLRNTFVVAAETLIDDADKIDLKATDAATDDLVQQLRAAKDNLSKLVEDDREKDIAATASDLVFAVTACHLQATNGADTTTCRAQYLRARSRVMESIRKHKQGATWVDGPPMS